MGFVPAKVVMRVAVNFSRIAMRSSDLIWGDNVEVVGIDEEPAECGLSREVESEMIDPAKMNFAAAWISSSG